MGRSVTVNLNSATPPTPPGPSGLWVSGYYAGYFWDWGTTQSWEDPQGREPYQQAVDRLDLTTLTHVAFCRYSPGGGTLGGTPPNLVLGGGTWHTWPVGNTLEQRMIAKCRAAGKPALMCIGGVGDGYGFEACTTNANRATFIDNILDRCELMDYDGVDMDWEDNTSSAACITQQQALMYDIRVEAGNRARWSGANKPFVLTWPWYCKNINTDSVAAWEVNMISMADQMNLMSYGMNFNVPGTCTWFFGPLKDGAPNRPMSIETSIAMYAAAGVPRNKIGLGMGLYANCYIGGETSMRQTPVIQQWTPGDSELTWAVLYNRGAFNVANSYRWDPVAECGYYYYSPAFKLGPPWATPTWDIDILTTEDIDGTIQAKGAYAKAGNCGGCIVWMYNYGFVNDTIGNPPMQAIKAAFL